MNFLARDPDGERIAALEAENEELRDLIGRLLPGWAAYEEACEVVGLAPPVVEEP